MIELLKELISIPSHSREEKEAADCLQKWMEAKAIPLKRTLNNIWAESEVEGKKPTVLLNAHIDTVRPAPGYTRDPYKAEEVGDRIYGLGSNDDGGSLVALLEVYSRLYKKDLPYRLVFSATSEEEVCGAGGIDAIFDEIGNVDLGIIGEPTGMDMAVAEKGLMVLDCVCTGKSGHAARGEGINAIYLAMDDIEWFRNYRFDKVSSHLGEVKMTVTIIEAGTQHNVIPDSCKFTVDVRPNGEYTNQEILDIIKSHVKCTVTPRSMKHNSSSIPMNHPFVRAGIDSGLKCFGSPTTSNQTRCSFTTVKLGPGDSSRSHTADEYICISEINSAIDTYINLLERYGDTLE